MAPTERSERATVKRRQLRRRLCLRGPSPATAATESAAKTTFCATKTTECATNGEPESSWSYTRVVPALHVTPVPVLLVTGPPGVGKTSVASELSELLDKAGVPYAFVDVDSLRWCYPRRADDPFRVQLAMQNLAAIWPNFAATGAAYLVLVDVIESRAELSRIRAAVPGADVCVVRLRATVETLVTRVQHREPGLASDRHLQRAHELALRMDGNPVEDILVETDGRTIPAIANQILKRSGWLAPVYG
jgi:chloramphenicol 3-O-phosphotransferase